MLHCPGPKSNSQEVYDQFQFEDDSDRQNPDAVLLKLEEYCNTRKNEALETYRFWKVPKQEPFDTFVTEQHARAETWNFQEKERMVREKILFSTQGKLQELLLCESDIDLKQAINICRAFEATKQST